MSAGLDFTSFAKQLFARYVTVRINKDEAVSIFSSPVAKQQSFSEFIIALSEVLIIPAYILFTQTTKSCQDADTGDWSFVQLKEPDVT